MAQRIHRLSLALRVSVFVYFAFWIVRHMRPHDLNRILENVRWGYLWTGLFIFLISQCLSITRWWLLLPKDASHRWMTLARIFLIATFFNTFLPTTVGGDFVRGYDLVRATGRWQASVAGVIVDRFVGFLGLIPLIAISGAILPGSSFKTIPKAGGFIIIAAGVLAVLALFSPAFQNFFLFPFKKWGFIRTPSPWDELREVLSNYLRRPKTLMAAFAMAVLIHFLTVALYSEVARALGLLIPFRVFFLIIPILLVSSQLPVTIGGWGVREGAAIFLLGPYGASTEQAFSLSIVCAALPFFSGIIGGMLFLAQGVKIR